MAEVKRLVRETTKIEALVPGFLARHVMGEAPGAQDVIEYKAGDVLEVEKSTFTHGPKGEKVIIGGIAENLVRARRAKFLDPREAKVFIEGEKLRLGEELYNHLQNLPVNMVGTRNFLNDFEQAEAQKLASQPLHLKATVKA